MALFEMRAVGIAAFCALIIASGFSPPFAQSEWYLSGYGGNSFSGKISDVTMPNYGQQLAFQKYPPANPAIGGATLTQTFNTSDVDLKSSAIFGGKAGYFFRDEGLPWLGVELEAFTSKPNIKTQTLSTHQYIAYTPNVITLPCTILTCPNQSTTDGTLPLTESSLRVVTVAFNVVARYPGKVFQPYAGAGGAGFYFNATNGTIQGHQWAPGFNALAGLKILVTDEWGLFVEGKYNLVNINNLDQTFGLSGQYQIFYGVAGIAYHF